MSRSLQELREFQKNLITNATRSELKLYKYLTNNNYSFEFQYIISPFICDFVFLKEKKIIELDSPRFHNKMKDASRDLYLSNSGFSVHRIMSYRVFKSLPDVMKEIDGFLAGKEVVKMKKPRKKKS